MVEACNLCAHKFSLQQLGPIESIKGEKGQDAPFWFRTCVLLTCRFTLFKHLCLNSEKLFNSHISLFILSLNSWLNWFQLSFKC